MNTTPRVMSRCIENNRASCVRGTSSPTTSTRTGFVCSAAHRIRQCLLRMPLSTVLCTIRHRSTRGGGHTHHICRGEMGSGFRDGRRAVMLVHPWDASNHDDEWGAVLHEFDFGQLIALGGPDRVLPV